MTSLDHPLLVVVLAHHHGPELLPSLLIDLGEGRHLPTLTSETHQRLLTDRVKPLGSLEAQVLVLQELGLHLGTGPEIASIGVKGGL